MSMPSPDPLLVATWANEETLAAKGGAANERHHIAEDREAAIARGGRRGSRLSATVGRIKSLARWPRRGG